MSEGVVTYSIPDGVRQDSNVTYAVRRDEPQVFEWDADGWLFIVELWPDGRMVIQQSLPSRMQYRQYKLTPSDEIEWVDNALRVGARYYKPLILPGAPSALAYALSRTWVRQ